jgi:UDP-N-acetylmuramate-alanine ligase
VANIQFDNVDFLLDSKKVVDSFRTCINDVTEFGCIIYICKQLFQNINFQNSHVDFSQRQGNRVAYELNYSLM